MGDRLGHKKRSKSSRFFKAAEDVGDFFGKAGGGLATAGAISSATGIGAAVGVPAAAAGAVLGGVGAITGGLGRVGEAATSGDLEKGVEGIGSAIGGFLGLRK
jgi:hypothetical protein